MYNNTFHKQLVGTTVVVHFKGELICEYPMNDVIKSDLTNVVLNDSKKTEYYIKDGKVYSYSHVKEITHLIVDNVA